MRTAPYASSLLGSTGQASFDSPSTRSASQAPPHHKLRGGYAPHWRTCCRSPRRIGTNRSSVNSGCWRQEFDAAFDQDDDDVAMSLPDAQGIGSGPDLMQAMNTEEFDDERRSERAVVSERDGTRLGTRGA